MKNAVEMGRRNMQLMQESDENQVMRRNMDEGTCARVFEEIQSI